MDLSIGTTYESFVDSLTEMRAARIEFVMKLVAVLAHVSDGVSDEPLSAIIESLSFRNARRSAGGTSSILPVRSHPRCAITRP